MLGRRDPIVYPSKPANGTSLVYDVLMPRRSERLWTKDELVAIADQRGAPASPRLITDWVQLGLLDHPKRHGLGQGRGTVAGWPESQVRLWVLLVDKRPGLKQMATLCNIPVALWLYFGDDYVQLPQVRRAMTTWAGGTHTRGYRDAASLVLQFVDEIPGIKLKASRRKLVQSHLVGVVVNGLGSRSLEQFRTKLIDLLSPASTQRRSPPKETWVGHVELLLARLEAVRRIRTGEVADSLYYWARVLTHSARTGWAEQVGAPTFQELIPNACRDLATTIGLSLTMPKAPMTQSESLLNPEIWKERQLVDHMTWSPRVSRLVLPTGDHPITGLELQHSVTGQPAGSEKPSADH